MGIGVIVGDLPTVHHYLFASDHPVVRLWWIAMAGVLATGTVWMLVGGGADALARHPGLPYVPRWSAGKLKLFWVGIVIWNVVIGDWIVTGFGRGAPSPPFGAAFPFFFAGMFIGVSYLLSAMGGWSTLANDYRTDAPFAGALLRMRSGQLGMVNYGACLNLGSSAEGLYLSTMFLFRLGHPPLFIPWSDVEHHDTKRWFFKVTEIRFSKHPTVTVELSRHLAHKLLSHRPPEFGVRGM